VVEEEVIQGEEDILDHYEDVSEQKKEQGKPSSAAPPKVVLMQTGSVDDDIDFDYSQTHLEDFLRTHG
jgi:hypothetical protein